MSYTKRDYEAVAQILRSHKQTAPHPDVFVVPTISSIQACLSRIFAADNPRFDAERFAKACEPGHVKVLHGQCSVCLHYGDDCTGDAK